MSMNRVDLAVFGLLCAVIAISAQLHANQVSQNAERYRKALNDLESASPGPRKGVIRTILTPVDYPLPDVPGQTRSVIGLLLGDENREVRQSAALQLSTAALVRRKSDPSAYRRIMAALSRAMADDPDPICRRFAAFTFEHDAAEPGIMDHDTRTLCEPYWKRALHDTDPDVAEYAKDFLAAAK